MRRVLAAICSLAVGAAVVGCGSGQTGAASGQSRPPGAAAVTHGAMETLRLVGATQDVLDEMYDDTRRLASGSVPRQETLTEVKQLSERASGFRSAAEQLPPTNPARPLIAAADHGIVATATTLRSGVLASASPGALRALGGALVRLRVHVGRIAREVTPLDRTQISQDLAVLRQRTVAVSAPGH